MKLNNHIWCMHLIFRMHIFLIVTCSKLQASRAIPSQPSLSSLISPPSFSPVNFIVRFNPYVAFDDSSNAYAESDIVQMVSLISTQFSNVLVPRISVRDVNSSLSLIVPSIAKFNLMHDTTRGRHMRVFMAFGDNNPGGTSNQQSSFDIVFQLAEKANSIHPGTVEYLLVKPKGLGEDNANQTLKELIHGKEKIGRKPYKLGGLFPLSACGVENANTVSSYLEPLLEHLELAVFSVSPDRQDYIDGVEKTISRYTQKFQSCKDLLEEVDPFVEPAFRTSWADCDCDGNKNTSNFIYFWRKMNEWAVETKTKMFMLEAFDIPIRGGVDKFKGWWKLVSRRSMGDDIYQDKLGSITQFVPRPSAKASEGINFLGMVLIVVFASVILLMVVIIAFFVAYKRVSSKIKNGQHELSSEEVQEFFEGAISNQAEGGRFQLVAKGSVDELLCSVNAIAYNKEYELEKKDFVIEEDSILGSGNFGIVCRGKVLKQSEEIEVAVKMLKVGGPKTGLKGLLSETKLQSRLGKHENVVSLIGAYTSELKKGKVYVFTELCEMGSLEKHLKNRYSPRYSMPPEKNSSFNDDDISESGFEENVEPNRQNSIGRGGQPQRPDADVLYRWSYEIARGMQFLASKKVVHADLATRNVLLTQSLSAKISDFGLSRRLYDYTSYIKSEPEPLPWAWMAPESLRRMEFNEKTDVWSYGITLWEIYSMGVKPYPGLAWSWDFSAKLMNGLRPGEPEFNSNNMYITMLKCWNVDPDRRPTFKELQNSFSLVTPL